MYVSIRLNYRVKVNVLSFVYLTLLVFIEAKYTSITLYT